MLTKERARRREDLPSFAHVRRIAEAHSAALAAAIAGGVAGISAAIAQALRAVPSPMEDLAHMEAVARGAISSNVTAQTSRAALDGLYREASAAGAEAAANEIRIALGSEAPAGGGQAMADLLARARITLQGIDATTLDRLGTALRDGIAAGSSASEIASAMAPIVNDPLRAGTIAMTEANRAYSAAGIDAIESAGYAGWNWVAYSSACDVCLDIESANPQEFGDPEPPAHPNCMCSYSGVLQ